MACSTCHVIVAKEDFDRLPPASEEEDDLLDLAWQVEPDLAARLPDQSDRGSRHADRADARRGLLIWIDNSCEGRYRLGKRKADSRVHRVLAGLGALALWPGREPRFEFRQRDPALPLAVEQLEPV